MGENCLILSCTLIGLICSALKRTKSLHPEAVEANWSNQRNLFVPQQSHTRTKSLLAGCRTKVYI